MGTRLLNASAPSAGSQPSTPSLAEVLILVAFSYAVFYAALLLGGGSYLIGGRAFGDNPAYLDAATAIRHWQFAGVTAKQFWGLSYAVAGLSAVTMLPERGALVLLCVAASLISVALCYRLWGGWIAIFFALLSLDWFQRSLLGGAEPLFMVLIFLAFLALRHLRVGWSSLSSAFATIVRPFGLFALIALGIHLLWQKKFRECILAVGIALLIGLAYMWPLAHYLGNPLANVTSYQKADWRGGLPFSLPFVTIVRDTITGHAPATNLALTSLWAVLVLTALIHGIHSGDFQRYAASYTAETLFVCLYCLALYTYAAPDWARSNFPRFALPMLPWTLVFLDRYLPTRRWVVGWLAVIAPVLAAASALGIRNVAASIGAHLH